MSNFVGLFIPQSKLGSAVVGVVVSVLLTLAAALLGIEIVGNYGWSILIGLPFVMGLFSLLIHGYHQPQSLGTCLATANCAVLLAGAGFLLFAMEGAICLLMAAPLAFAIASLGGVFG